MPPSIRQTSFGAGELSPLLWGRTDLPQYGRGMRTMRNFVPTRHGAAMSRPGTTFVDGAKFVDSPSLGVIRDIGQARLIPFNAGDAQFQSYALEFGQGYIRFITSGARVLDALNNPYEVVTPYSNTDIWQLQYAQIGDVLILACPNWDPLELRRNGPTNWTLTPVSFAAFSPYASDVDNPVQATTGFTMVVPDDWAPATAYAEGNRVVADDGYQARMYECIVPGISDAATVPSSTQNPVPDGTVQWKFVQQVDADPDHPAKEWQYLWTAIVKDKVTGALYETLGEPVLERFNGTDYDDTLRPLGDEAMPIYPDMPVTLRRAETAGLLSTPAGWDTYVVQEYLLYRGAGGLFGFLGSTKTREFVDLGFQPNYAIQPPQGTQPFGTEIEATGAAYPFNTRHLDRPSAVAFFQQKLVFGGLTRFPGDLYASKTNDFQNWDARLYYDVAGEALHFELAARRRESIRSFGVLGRLMTMTDASAWSVGGVQGSPLDFDSVEVRVEEEIGAATLQPLVISGALLYARAKGRGVRALVPQDQMSPLAGVDISELAQHLFTGQKKNLVDWCYQEDPFGLVWAVRADGVLLSLTYARDAWAWAHHDTDGLIESVCSVPEGTEDAVYLVVVRDLGEAGKHRYIERMTSRVQYDGPTFNGDLLDVPPDFICLDSALEYYGGAEQLIGGLEHLEGKEVWVVGPKMDPLGPLMVTGGEIDFGDVLEPNVNPPVGAKLLIYVGLLFTPQLETLDVAGGEARLKKKTVERVGFEADQSLGMRIGQSLDALDDWDQRDVDDGYNPVSAATVLVDMPVESTWDQSARAALEQAMPLPVTIVGITRELALGD